MGKNNICLVYALACVLLAVVASCSRQISVERGVSKDLAQMRKEYVSDVRYDVLFVLPDSIDEPVRGVAKIAFDWQGKCDLPIDYAAEPDSAIVDVDVNGVSTPIMIENEHITIPASLLKRGGNEVAIPFKSNDKTLNRHIDYMYSLFVPANARTAFPCFDQPDMKAEFTLTLDMPAQWKAISNAPQVSRKHSDGRAVVRFKPTKLLPTYLMSFVAGDFKEKTAQRDGRMMTALYRKQDSSTDGELDEIFDIIAHSIRWMEDYTGVKYPFEKYDLAIIPGYQFGGMEHPGAVQYSERRLLLGDNPTPDEKYSRFNVLAHETSHMWFGDMVTMKWFDDVWTKEIFANYFADKIQEGWGDNDNRDFDFVRAHYETSYSTDRTSGTHPIGQDLENLNMAGLLYGNIIYHKAPIMLDKMAERMGDERLRTAIQKYLKKYAYGNATWDDLIAILDQEAPEADIRDFDRVWVKEASLPTITTHWSDGEIVVRQTDPLGRGLVWKQIYKIGLYNASADSIAAIEVNIAEAETRIPWPEKPDAILPNLDGKGYGRFVVEAMPQVSYSKLSAAQRLSLAIICYDNYLNGNIGDIEAMRHFRDMLAQEGNERVASSICGYMFRVSERMPLGKQAQADEEIYAAYTHSDMPLVKKLLAKGLMTSAVSPSVVDEMQKIWEDMSIPSLSNRDYMRAAYHLAIMKPGEATRILAKQRERLASADEMAEFDYISRGCTASADERKALLQALEQKENRINEPWAGELLALICDKTRGEYAKEYVLMGLNMLPRIQQTSDIFFPATWLKSLLSGSRTPEVQSLVATWIDEHPQLSPLLIRKINEASH